MLLVALISLQLKIVVAMMYKLVDDLLTDGKEIIIKTLCSVFLCFSTIVIYEGDSDLHKKHTCAHRCMLLFCTGIL